MKLELVNQSDRPSRLELRLPAPRRGRCAAWPWSDWAIGVPTGSATSTPCSAPSAWWRAI